MESWVPIIYIINRLDSKKNSEYLTQNGWGNKDQAIVFNQWEVRQKLDQLGAEDSCYKYTFSAEELAVDSSTVNQHSDFQIISVEDELRDSAIGPYVQVEVCFTFPQQELAQLEASRGPIYRKVAEVYCFSECCHNTPVTKVTLQEIRHIAAGHEQQSGTSDAHYFAALLKVLKLMWH